jgi:hypothetical protein
LAQWELTTPKCKTLHVIKYYAWDLLFIKSGRRKLAADVASMGETNEDYKILARKPEEDHLAYPDLTDRILLKHFLTK